MFYVIICARSKKDTQIAYITIQGSKDSKLVDIHNMAADGYRKKFNLQSNIHIQTTKLFEAETEIEIQEFVNRLDDLMFAKKEGEKHGSM